MRIFRKITARITELKVVFFFVITLNILVAFLTYSGLLAKFFFPSNQSALLSQLSPEKEVQLFLGYHFNIFPFLNLRTVDNAGSTEELDYLLNIRKLIVFSVHELNKPLKYTKCAKWWANPLDLDYHESKIVSTAHADDHLIHLIKFRIQPGNLKVVVTIRQQMSAIRVGIRELNVLGFIKIQESFKGKACYKDHIRKEFAETCLCVDSEQFKEYTEVTAQLRKNWEETDGELTTWRPNESFYVTDYMNFNDYEWFVTSPGNTLQDMAKLNYSTEYCGPDIKMLVMVSSAPTHFEQRKIIRSTYASLSNLKGKGIKVAFLMGIPTDGQLNDDVKREADEWKDIIQANFKDSYHNLTISHLSMYKWAHLTCVRGTNSSVTVPQFILKADDDFLLNLELALKVAQQNLDSEFIGCLYCGTPVVRNLDYMTKYYTPRYMHISNSYTGYVSGVSYIMRTDVIPNLLHMSITTPIIHMDDAYVSGILLRQLKIIPRNSAFFTYARTDPDPCKSKQVVSSYVVDPSDMAAQWEMLMSPIPANCMVENMNMKVETLSEENVRACFFNYV